MIFIVKVQIFSLIAETNLRKEGRKSYTHSKLRAVMKLVVQAFTGLISAALQVHAD